MMDNQPKITRIAVKVGSNVLVGEDAKALALYVSQMTAAQWKPCAIPERWDGRSAERILQTLLELPRK